MRDLITDGTVGTVHDCSDGGLYVAVAEMALAGDRGADIHLPEGTLSAHAILFGEDQGRYVLGCSADKIDAVMTRAGKAGVTVRIAGSVGGTRLTVDGEDPISITDLRAEHEQWLPRYMSGG